MYKQEKYEDAGKNFVENANSLTDSRKKSSSYFNLGNSLLSSNKVKESIEAYKNSLKLNPGNQEAKFNLAYAQDLLRQQEQEQQQQQNQDQNKDKQDNNKNDQDQDKEKNNKNQDTQNQEQQGNQQQQQQQQQQPAVSREDAQRLLDALANDEKKVQEKVKEAKAASQKVRVRINW
jgi:Ca-activated chloride channel family protein